MEDLKFKLVEVKFRNQSMGYAIAYRDASKRWWYKGQRNAWVKNYRIITDLFPIKAHAYTALDRVVHELTQP